MASAQSIAIRITLKNHLKDEPDRIKDLFLGRCYYDSVEQAYCNAEGDRYKWNDGKPRFIQRAK